MRKPFGPAAALGLAWLACAPSFDTDYGLGNETQSERCASDALAIHDIQGSGAESLLSGREVSVEGIVTLGLANPDARTGFFMQARSPDSDPRTSEGVFVALPSGQTLPEPGRHVRLRGRVRERDGVTEVHAVELLDECGWGAIAPTPISLPAEASAESWEGMWVSARADWTLIDAGRLLRDQSVTVSDSGRLYAPGHELGEPTEAALTRRWILDPSSAASLPESSPFEAGSGGNSGRLRLGARLSEVTGVVDLAGAAQRLWTTRALEWRATPPPAPARERHTTLRVVGLNLDNYFARVGLLGARSEEELLRQRAKLVALLLAIDADLLALTELGNQEQSLVHLLTGLNERLTPEERYTFSQTEPPASSSLRAGLLYRASRVRSYGEAWFDTSPAFRRPPLFQSFETDESRFTVAVVHFKSKRCDAEPEVITSEGCGADTRHAEAVQLLEAARAARGAGLPESLLLMGDFNSDPLEAPIQELERAGLSDLLDSLPDAERYSYVFEGRASLLDHAFATRALGPAVLSAAIWHVNADEPGFRSYALDNPPREYRADAFRASDHDPVSVDLQL